ncbi:MAG: hypothetical protein MR218_08485 [Eubacterium sp.]|nr:hypothetical protein [Eubacterium sp.]
MEKKEIINMLTKNDSTILSFPDRGPWGDSRYRGNCSGWIQAFLIWKYQARKMAELFAGSGTGSDVCRDMQIPYIGADLNPSPVRDNILAVNAVSDEVPDSFRDADLLFMHPPYGAEIGIPYAGSMWKDPGRQLSPSDLGQMPWDKFMRTLNAIVMKYYAAMENGARMAVLMGDVRRKGQFHSMLADIVKPGNLEQIIVKAQHNCVSNGRQYSAKGFVPITHEFLMVVRKPGGYFISFQLPQQYRTDIRDSESATWTDVVYAVVQTQETCTLTDIYTKIEGNKKAKKNPHWKEKVRQVLGQHPSLFHQRTRGVWAAKAAA